MTNMSRGMDSRSKLLCKYSPPREVPIVGNAPTPDGCRWCGRGRALHGYRWSPDVGGHRWTMPTDAQRLERMRARRKIEGGAS